MSGPPPPPPAPQLRGPPPPQNFRPGPPQGPQGGPPPQGRPGPPPGQGFPPLPFRQESMRISDITPPKLMDESTCLKKLTTYAAFTIRKAPVRDPKKDKPTWARSEVNDEKLDQSDIIKQIKKLNETGKPVAEKKAALFPNQAAQITKLLDELIFKEPDRNFEWTLAQIDRREKTSRNGIRETVTMTVFFKRTPLAELNPVMLHRDIERSRHERMLAQNRPPPQQQPQQQQPPPMPQPQQHNPPTQIIHHGGGPQKGGPQFDRKPSKSKLPVPKKDGRPQKKYHSDSSNSSFSEFDSDSDFSEDSSNDTTISSRSPPRNKRDKGNRVRSYSRHRPEREHRKNYYIDPRGYSPERPGQYRDAAPRHYSVPDVPRAVVGGIPAFDPVAAAYQAGKIDADAERFNRERDLELERLERLERERYIPPPRPLILDRPVVIERAVPVDRPLPIEPRAIVSYSRPEPRRYDTAPPRHFSDAGQRYVDERWDDFRSPREDDYYRRVGDAEEYIERESRRPRDFMERRRSDYVGASERVGYRDAHPFAPRRAPYPPSESSGW